MCPPHSDPLLPLLATEHEVVELAHEGIVQKVPNRQGILRNVSAPVEGEEATNTFTNLRNTLLRRVCHKGVE